MGRQVDSWVDLNPNIRTRVGVKDIDNNVVDNIGVIPDAVKPYVSVDVKGDGIYRQVTLTLAALPQTIANGASEWVGTKLYTFPEGRMLVLGATASLAPTTTSVLADTITTGTTGTFGLGSVTNDGTHTGTKVDLLPDGNFTSSTTINVAAAAVNKALAAAAQFDGTTAPLAAFFNTKCATNTADGTLTWAGTIKFTFVQLGDY